MRALRIIIALALLAFPLDCSAADEPVYLDQGSSWNAVSRDDFYTRDQGSRLIPLSWLMALKQGDGQPFLADSLVRYGYLKNPAGTAGLPIGFHASGPTGAQTVGMTCAACHTREIKVGGKAYRVDGGPALVDFHAFLTDLDKAVGNAVASDAAFASFAASVLQTSSPDQADVAALRRAVDFWYLRYHAIMSRALPAMGWGLGRLDAVGMIFNRISGLDIGPGPDALIVENIKTADAPARYPFIWDAPTQDKTQWPGFLGNGSDVLGLARNVGEVLGVFASFQPKPRGALVDFLSGNSANFDGLAKLEDLVKQISAPKWPWKIDISLAAKGKDIFERPAAGGGCSECHGIKPGIVRLPFVQTWATPVLNVGTDTRQYDVLGWTANSGVLKGTYIPLATSPLKETDLVLNILATSVIGTIAEHVLTFGGGDPGLRAAARLEPGASVPAGQGDAIRLPPTLRELPGAFNVPEAVAAASDVRQRLGLGAAAGAPPAKGAYEARVLRGIWAAAPYLHNGSVASLAELLKPAAQRKDKFRMGTDFDPDNVGIAGQQSQGNYERLTTDCSDRNSGNSRCGHEYGTGLTDDDKKALIEYLKTL